MTISWEYDQNDINWGELSNLYRIAPLGNKSPEDLKLVFSNSRFKCFIFDDSKLIGAGRALADGRDCSYICDVAVHPDYQNAGLGTKIVSYLVERSHGHRKIILYTIPGKEGFYHQLGFKCMNTALAIFEDQEDALASGFVR
jgi:ribosomal protein S18 acetylase RimI-like enzyme